MSNWLLNHEFNTQLENLIKSFLEQGLSVDQLIDSLHIAKNFYTYDYVVHE